MGIGILIVAIGLIIKKREKIQKVLVRYKNKIFKNKELDKEDPGLSIS